MQAKSLLVARRELLENIRTKTFWLGILVFPVVLVFAVLVPALLEGSKSTRTYAVVDHSGWLLEAVDQRIDKAKPPVDPPSADDLAQGPEEFNQRSEDFIQSMERRFRRVEVQGEGPALLEELNRQVAEEELFAYFVIGEDPVSSGEGNRYVSSNLTDDELRRWFARHASAVVQERRMAQENIDPEVAQWVQASLRFDVKRLGEEGQEEAVDVKDLVRQWAPVAFVYMLWISIFTISQMLLTNTIEEKSNRIMEVLLSSLSPVQLMAGKILGIASTGLIMIGSWIAFFFFAVKIVPAVLGLDLGFDLGIIATDPVYLGSFVAYFILGYLLFSTLFVGIGSLCNSLKEAQNLQIPVTLVLMVPLFAMIPIAQDPNGALAKVLSYIPPFTPFVMMNRAAGPPSAMEYAVTTILLLLSITVSLWATAKVFRIGILMTGKPPRFFEVIKWLKAPVGVVPARKD